MLFATLLVAAAAPLAAAQNTLIAQTDLGNCSTQCTPAYEFQSYGCDSSKLKDSKCLSYCPNAAADRQNCMTCYMDSTKGVAENVKKDLSNAVADIGTFCSAATSSSSATPSSSAAASAKPSGSRATAHRAAAGVVAAALAVALLF